MTLRQYIQLLKLRIGGLIALTALMGYALVAESFNPVHLVLLVVVMLLGSAGSSVFNHFYDRDIDRLMSRTANRPLASNAMERPEFAVVLAGGLLLLGCALAVLAFNWLVALHLFLGAFVYGVIYTIWLKRRHWMNIVIGGAAGSFAVMAGAAAVDPSQWLLPTIMAIFLFLWTPSHFWALSILLKDDYAKAGVPMLPVTMGVPACTRYIFWNTVLLVISSLVPVAMGLLGPIYGVAAALLGARFLWMSWDLMQENSKDLARRVFLFSMTYLAAVFVAVVADRHVPTFWA